MRLKTSLIFIIKNISKKKIPKFLTNQRAENQLHMRHQNLGRSRFTYLPIYEKSKKNEHFWPSRFFQKF